MDIEIIGTSKEIIIESISNLMYHFDLEDLKINYSSGKLLDFNKYSMTGTLDSISELREYNNFLQDKYEVKIYVL